MTAQQLKNSILQMAVQGKLVPQDKNDEPASVLLERIKAEKKVSPIKDDDIPFDIPNGWEWCRLNYICEIARGGSPRPIKEFLTEAADGINWIKIGDSDKGGKYINSTKEKIKPEGMSKSRFVHAGDFLLTNSMSFGRPYILNVDGCIHDGWLVLSGYNTAYDKDFLYYMLSSRFAYYQFCDVVSGAVVKNLNSDKVANAIFPLPPLEEQKRIVAKIEELLPYIEKYDKAETKLTELNAKFPDALKKSILQEAVQGKLVPQNPDDEPASVLIERIKAEKQKLIKEGKIKKDKFEAVNITSDVIPYEIPNNWVWCNLNDVVIQVADIDHKMPPTVEGNGYPYISPLDFTDNGIDFEKAKKIGKEDFDKLAAKVKPKRNDIIFPRYGTIGVIRLVETDIDFLVSYSCCTIQNTINMDYKYVYYVLKSPLIRDEINKYINKTTQPNVGLKSIKSFLFPLPPLEEQKRIVAKIEELMPFINAITK